MDKTIDAAMAYLAAIMIVLAALGFPQGIFNPAETSLSVTFAVASVAANAAWRN